MTSIEDTVKRLLGVEQLTTADFIDFGRVVYIVPMSGNVTNEQTIGIDPDNTYIVRDADGNKVAAGTLPGAYDWAKPIGGLA